MKINTPTTPTILKFPLKVITVLSFMVGKVVGAWLVQVGVVGALERWSEKYRLPLKIFKFL